MLSTQGFSLRFPNGGSYSFTSERQRLGEENEACEVAERAAATLRGATSKRQVGKLEIASERNAQGCCR